MAGQSPAAVGPLAAIRGCRDWDFDPGRRLLRCGDPLRSSRAPMGGTEYPSLAASASLSDGLRGRARARLTRSARPRPALLGARDLVRRESVLGLFLPAWFAALILLAYAPVTVQRRLADGAWVALAVLAARGISTLRWSDRWRRVAAALLLAAALPTTLILIGGGWWAVARPSVPLYRPAAEVRAMNWLADHAAPEQVVLASFDTGNVLPAWAPIRSVIGHGPETAGLAELRPKVEGFFGNAMTESERRALLVGQSVDFVLVGPEERKLGPWESIPPELRPVYDESGYTVYSVDEP